MTQTFFIDGVLPGLNEVLAAAKQQGRSRFGGYKQAKARLNRDIGIAIKAAKIKPVERANFIFTWCEPTQKRDKDNVRIGAKFILDALVETKVLANDGWKQVGTLTDCYEVDTKRPGVRVEMIEL